MDMQKDEVMFQVKDRQTDIADLSDEQAGVYELSDEQLESVHGCGGSPLSVLSSLTGPKGLLNSL